MPIPSIRTPYETGVQIMATSSTTETLFAKDFQWSFSKSSNIPEKFMFPHTSNHWPESEGFDPLITLPEFVQPKDLDVSNANPTIPVVIQNSDSILAQPFFATLSPPAIPPGDGSYRPREATDRRKRRPRGRVEPRSQEHARRLELDRTAAARSRKRRKISVEELQQRCKQEEERLRTQRSLVSTLRNHVLALRIALVRQSACDCQSSSVPPQ
jgi:hypothetical protein